MKGAIRWAGTEAMASLSIGLLRTLGSSLTVAGGGSVATGWASLSVARSPALNSTSTCPG